MRSALSQQWFLTGRGDLSQLAAAFSQRRLDKRYLPAQHVGSFAAEIGPFVHEFQKLFPRHIYHLGLSKGHGGQAVWMSGKRGRQSQERTSRKVPIQARQASDAHAHLALEHEVNPDTVAVLAEQHVSSLVLLTAAHSAEAALQFLRGFKDILLRAHILHWAVMPEFKAELL